MTEDLDAFLAGDRADDVAIYVADEVVDDPEKLVRFGHRTDDGLVLVLDGETGRSVFQTATGVAPMGFAKEAGDRTGTVYADLTGGECPELEAAGESPGDHRARFLLSFVQLQTEGESVADRYAEGDVVHAYVQCACGTAYSDRWVAGENAEAD
jgi:hypothetical protein